MTTLFLDVINMSIAAGWLVLAVVLLRKLLTKAPKWSHVLLWGIVAVRLLLPISIESVLSLIPSAKTLPDQVISGPSFQIQTGITPVDDRVNDYLGTAYFEGVTVPANNGYEVMTALTVVWMIGMLAMMIYTAVTCLRLKKRVETAVLLRDNIYQSEQVSSPFVLGVIRPRIYLPFAQGGGLSYVIGHEQAHIRRGDHLWKPFGFLLLTVYWFNPLMWLAYGLLCRDIELACDEKVIRELDDSQRADYSQALLSWGSDRKLITACPLAFGEVGVKERVASVLNYKKPGFWIGMAAAAACVIAAVCFLTNPVSGSQTVMGANYRVADVIYDVSGEVPAEPYCVTADYQLYRKKPQSENWIYLGKLEPYPLTKKELEAYCPREESWKKGYRLDKITDAYILRLEDQMIYLVFRTKDGDTLLGYGWEDISERNDPYSDDTSLQMVVRLESEDRELPVGKVYGYDRMLVRWSMSSFIDMELGFDFIVGQDFIAQRLDDGEIRVLASDTSWQAFPYTDEEWAKLCEIEAESVQNIKERYEKIEYYPLDSDGFCLRLDGEIWWVDIWWKKDHTSGEDVPAIQYIFRFVEKRESK